MYIYKVRGQFNMLFHLVKSHQINTVDFDDLLPPCRKKPVERGLSTARPGVNLRNPSPFTDPSRVVSLGAAPLSRYVPTMT